MSGSISVTAFVRRTLDLYARQASLLLPTAVCLVGVVTALGACRASTHLGLRSSG
jgi:hypothetical protein